MAFTPANPWNFPMYRAPGNYSAGLCDVYFTPANAVSDFVDTGAVTGIIAVYMPPGFNASSQTYDTAYPQSTNTYNHFFTIGRKNGGIDNHVFMRGYYDTGTGKPGIQTHIYDGTTYRGISTRMAEAGFPIEGTLLQIAFSVNPTTGKVQQVINGNYREVSYGAGSWSTMNMHTGNIARMVLNHRASNSADAFNFSCNQEVFYGPLLILDEAIDLTPESADYNRIFDENGDFLWAGEDGALWLSDNGSKKPWYYSQNYVPTTQKGTMTASWTQYVSNMYGHPCGSKNDFLEPAHVTLAKTMPSIKLLWDMSRPWGHHYPWISVEHIDDSLRQLSVGNYQNHRWWPAVEGRWGSVAFDHGVAGYGGYYSASSANSICALPALATELSMTLTMDFTSGNNETFGYRKICGWGTSSSSANFRFIGPWTSESGRWLQMSYAPNGLAIQWTNWTVPNDSGQCAWTIQWNNGHLEMWFNGTKVRDLDHSGTTTQLNNSSTQQFGLRDSSSAAGGNLLHSTDFFMVNQAALTPAQIVDLHNALRGI